MTGLDDVIARLEATGPCRELDAAIAMAIGWSRPQNSGFCGPAYSRRDEYEWHDEQGNARGFNPPRFTESIDSALTLVPRGSGYELTGYTANEQAEFILWDIDMARDTYSAVAPTPALAICIAALRAQGTQP